MVEGLMAKHVTMDMKTSTTFVVRIDDGSKVSKKNSNTKKQ
jgi:hypothetical protein